MIIWMRRTRGLSHAVAFNDFLICSDGLLCWLSVCVYNVECKFGVKCDS